MIETTVLNYLNANLDVPCYMEIPNKPPARFVIIEKTGSSYEDHVRWTATMTIQSYAGSLFEAASLNEEVKEAMLSYPPEGVVSISLVGDYNYTDTTKKTYRYQAVFSLVHY